MRYLDIAVAAMVALTAIAAMVVWSPGAADLAADRLRTKSALRDALVAFVDREGVPWLFSAPLPDVCAAAYAASSPAADISAIEGPQSCGLPPPAGATSVELTLSVASKQVTLVAWSGAAA